MADVYDTSPPRHHAPSKRPRGRPRPDLVLTFLLVAIAATRKALLLLLAEGEPLVRRRIAEARLRLDEAEHLARQVPGAELPRPRPRGPTQAA